jgi:2,6-dihydroxypyridine 3-monooxygenase
MPTYEEQRAIVVGGSIGGLTTALLLRDQGFRVDLFERTPTLLDGRGAGIVLQPDTVRWLTERRGDVSVEAVSTGSSALRYIGAGNEVVHEEPAEWRFTSWTTLYRFLLQDFGTENYHLGEFAVGVCCRTSRRSTPVTSAGAARCPRPRCPRRRMRCSTTR